MSAKLIIEYMSANHGRTDITPGNMASHLRSEIAKLERYVAKGGPKTEHYAAQLEKSRAVLAAVEEAE